MNILLVDHTTIYRDILQQALRGYRDLTLSLAVDAAAARAMIPGSEFHFVIVARHLPDIDGVDFVRELRASGQFMFEPIVLLTSSPTAELAALAERAGITEIFRKHDIDELVSFLRRFLGVYTPLRGRVLYVEDARDQRMALEAQLRSWNLLVDAVDSAEAAWEAFRQNEYDLLICDIVLQGRMTGSRLVNRIRRTSGRKGDIPILAMTAFDSAAKRIELFHVGIDDYVSKPVVLVELHARIHGILSRKLVSDRNRSLLDASSLAVLLTDERGVISTVNDEAVSLFGCGSSNFSGIDIAQFLPHAECAEGCELLQRFGVALDAVAARGLPWETVAQRRNGELFPIRFSVVETASMGVQRQFAVLVRDISSEREMESRLLQAKDEAEAATRLKSQFLANMSHEIRTPMNGIMGMMQLALDGELPEVERGYVGKAYDSARFLLGILDDILDFSKIEAGKLAFELQPFDLGLLLRRTEDLLGMRAREKGIGLSLSCAPDVPRALVGDVLRLSQVLNNLVGNAIKFTREGGVHIQVELTERGELAERVQLLFTIRDTGIGISSTQLGRLFQPFGQAEASTSREFGGSGLGLVISRHLVERMGGQISVESMPGVGSVFRFSAWFGLSAAVPVSLPSVESDQVSATLSGVHVLVAEDNPVNLELVCQYLRRVGVTADTAIDGKEAVALVLAAPERYRAILMDVQMPIMDGIEATRLIREDPACDQLPIIALTANAMVEDRQRCFEAGMQGYVAKPIDRDHLYATLVKCCTAPEMQTLPQTSSTVAEIPDLSQIELPPELEGFPAALRRMGGDREMYRFMYAEVLAGQEKVGDELRAAIAEGNWQLAKRLAHTLKGLAATLGATSLRSAAEMLEFCCARSGDEAVADCQLLLVGIEAGLLRLAELADHPLLRGE